jgi:hypothetical protein
MASLSKGDQPKKGMATPSLKEQAHQEIMDLYRVAEESSYPGIRASAIEMAREKNQYAQEQGARLPPTLVMWVIIVLGVATIFACWYAFLYQPEIAYQLSGISILLFVVISAIVLALCGSLSPANLMQVFEWAISYIKTKFGFGHKGSGDTLPQRHAESEDNTHPEK